MKYPSLQTTETSRDMIQVFGGINQALRIDDGEWSEAVNLTSENYPVLSTTKGFDICQQVGAAQLYFNDKLFSVIDGTDLYINGVSTGITLEFNDVRNFVSMGSYLLIFPDKYYYNTADENDHGYIERVNSRQMGSTFNVFLCDEYGKQFNFGTPSPTEPQEPAEGQLWMDSTSDPYVLKRWYGSSSMWMPVTSTYIGIIGTNYLNGFSVGDGITISGLSGVPIDSGNGSREQVDAIDGIHTIDYIEKTENGSVYKIVFKGFINGNTALNSAGRTLTVKRSVPDMDFVCEAQNRLWGCKYGTVNGALVNELYCCKLGDFKNWYVYSGISTDSWAASCGTPGPWTGCIKYNNNPVFFKENFMHTIYVSSSGAHQVVDKQVRGVSAGSARTLSICDEVLYYKSKNGVMAYTGSVPYCVSDKLCSFDFYKYNKCFAVSMKGTYYLFMQEYTDDQTSTWTDLIYDTSKGIWHQSDVLINSAATDGINLFAVVYGGKLAYDKTDRDLSDYGFVKSATDTASFQYGKKWHAITGEYGFEQPDHKYLSRFNFRIHLENGSHVRFYVQYDSDGIWHYKGMEMRPGLRSVTIPIAPRRCDHAKMKIEGEGQCKIYSVSKITETGSDM